MDMMTDKIFNTDQLADDYETLRELGDCYSSVEKYQQAQECYDRAAELEPDKAAPYVGIGLIALQSGKLDDALNAFKVAKRLENDCAKAYCGLAMVYQEQADYAQAFEHYLKCLDLDSDNVGALLGLFQASCQMGSFSKVIYYLEVYLEMHPKDTAVMFCLATLYVRDNMLSWAKETLADVIAIEPKNEEALNLLEEVDYLLAQTN
jgi:tetratricopeptide (TPR) repeat protein